MNGGLCKVGVGGRGELEEKLHWYTEGRGKEGLRCRDGAK